ncbi:hypothetical protein KSS87_015788, partial [Heliosperma pusillum]
MLSDIENDTLRLDNMSTGVCIILKAFGSVWIIFGFLKANDFALALDHLRIMSIQGFAADADIGSLFLGLLCT